MVENSNQNSIVDNSQLDDAEAELIVAQAETVETPSSDAVEEPDENSVPQTGEPNPEPPVENASADLIVEIADGGIVRLPADASIDISRINGENLEFVQPDGSVIIIPQGAVQALTFFVGTIEIPPQTVAALFAQNDIQAAAGPEGVQVSGDQGGNGSQSSGGNFARPTGDVGPGLPYGGLLPPTALAFGVNDEEPLYEGLLDDSPTVGDNPPVGLDDDALSGNPGGLDDDPDAVNVSGTLSFDYGDNGPGSVLFTGAILPAGFAFTVSPDGTSITVIQGSTAIFQLTLFDTVGGQYTVTQLAAASHPTPGLSEENLEFTIQYQVTDNDGDSATGSIVVDVDDDVPGTMTAEADAVIEDEEDSDGIDETPGSDESFVTGDVSDNGNWGADGFDRITKITIGVTEVTVPDGGSVTVYFAQDGSFQNTTLDGTTAASLLVNSDGTYTYTLIQNFLLGGTTAASLLVNSDGTYTYTLIQNFLLGNGTAGEQTNDVATVTFTGIDGDGDEATIALALKDTDDVPIAIAPETAALLNETGASFVGTLDWDGDIDLNKGADQGGTIRFPSTLTGTDSGLTSGGQTILYTVIDGGLTLIGYTGATAPTGTGDAGVVFHIALNPDGDPGTASDTYTMTMVGTVDGGANQIDFVDGGYAPEGGNLDWNGFVPIGQSLISPAPADDDGSQDLLITPVGAATSVNNNANGFGAGSGGGGGGGGGGQNIGAGEGLRFDFVNDLRGNPASTGSGNYQTAAAKRDHTFDSHYAVTGAFFEFGSAATGADVRFKAYDDYNDGVHNGTFDIVGDGAPDPITSVAITHNNVTTQINGVSGNYSVGGKNYTVTFEVGGTVLVQGLVTDDIVIVFTADTFSSAEVTYVDGDEFYLTGFGATAISPGDPVEFSVPVELVDGDGDTVSSNINLHLLPEAPATFDGTGNTAIGTSGSHYVLGTIDGAEEHFLGSTQADFVDGNAADNVMWGGEGNDFLSGAAGDDILIGGDGDDTLIGGPGSDEMTGGAGADTFVVSNDTLGASIEDFITDYNQAEGDVIDLTDLFTVGGGGNVDDYVNYNSATGELSVDSDGATNGANFQTVATLEDGTGSPPLAGDVTIIFDDNGTDTPTDTF